MFIFTELSGQEDVAGALITESRLIYETAEDQEII